MKKVTMELEAGELQLIAIVLARLTVNDLRQIGGKVHVMEVAKMLDSVTSKLELAAETFKPEVTDGKRDA